MSTMIFSAWEDSIDINTVNPRFEGRTCLMNAALAQQTDLVSYLLFRGGIKT